MRHFLPWASRLWIVPFYLAVPTLLLTANLWWAFTLSPVYLYAFQRFDVSAATGISPKELGTVASRFISYFSSPEEFLEVQVTIGGVRRPLFNERELIHLRDVKGLVQGVTRARNLALALVAVYVLGGFAVAGSRSLSYLAHHLRRATLGTGIGLVAVGILLAVAFPPLFRWFHVVSFRNPFWLLDPATDYLVRLFPTQFWYEVTLFVALATLLGALLLFLAAWGWLRLARRSERVPS